MVHKDKLTAEISVAADNYWEYIPAMIASALRSHRNIDEYIQRYRPLIDFGISPQQLSESIEILPTVPEKNQSLKIFFVSGWMKNFISVITKTEEREFLLMHDKKLTLQMKQIMNEIAHLQSERRKKLDSIFSFNEDNQSFQNLIESLNKVDTIKFDSLLKNDALARGKYFGLEDRRTLANERQWILSQERKIESLLSMIAHRETRTATTLIFDSIRNQLKKQLELRQEMNKLAERLYLLNEEILSISIEYISEEISLKIMRLKSTITAETERVGGETGVFRRVKEELINVDLLNSELKRIVEFDREIFANNFTTKHGVPSVLLVPGKGDGMYNSEENLIIIPMIPIYSLGNSLAAALVSYRLFHDESKQMIGSFGRIYSTKHSFHSLRMQFITAYSKWVNMEYEGYHVLTKEEREWFSHGFAPKIGDFYIPFEMIRGVLHGEKYTDLLERIKDGLENDTIQPEELWLGSIISCKKYELDKAELQIKKLLGMSKDYIFAQFNMGLIAIKLNRDEAAVQYFSNFISLKPPKWWAASAQEYLVALKNQD